MRNYIFFVLGGMLSGLIQGFALGSFGSFQDSANYFELYESISSLGVYEGAVNFAAQTLKIEPLIVILFGIENFFIRPVLTEYLFLVVNITLLNVILALVMYPLMDESCRRTRYALIFGFFIMSGYLVFSKELYFWRNIISFAFFILMARSESRYRYVWAIFSILAHSSFIIFISIFALLIYISNINRANVYRMFMVGTCGSIFLIQQFPDLFGLVTSGGDVSVFLAVGGEHTIKIWLSILFSLLILALVHSDYMENNKLRPLYLFCLTLVLASLFSYESYHLMNRIFLPASIIIGFLPFLISGSKLRFEISRVLIFLSVLPTVRLIGMLFSGDFSPA